MENKNVSNFSIRSLIRSICFVLLILGFCPSFLVSCSGQTMKISSLDVVKGIKFGNQEVYSGKPEALLLFVVPIVIFVILTIKKPEEKIAKISVTLASVVHFIAWLIFTGEIYDYAQSEQCSIKTTFYYKGNIFFQGVLILFMISLYVFKLPVYESTLGGYITAVKKKFNRTTINDAVTKVTNVVSKKPDIVGYCEECGEPIIRGQKFCMNCGANVAFASMSEEPEVKADTNELVCKNCGKKLQPGQNFCIECGAPVAVLEEKEEPVSVSEKEKKEIHCENCGARIQPGMKFCTNCGTPVDEEKTTDELDPGL